MSDNFRLAIHHWPYVSSLLTKPQTEADYDRLAVALDQLCTDDADRGRTGWCRQQACRSCFG